MGVKAQQVQTLPEKVVELVVTEALLVTLLAEQLEAEAEVAEAVVVH